MNIQNWTHVLVVVIHSIGDLHANALKMVRFCIQHHAFRMSEDNFKVLAEAYNRLDNGTNSSSSSMAQFVRALETAEPCEESKAPKLLRFLGDTLADRGVSCYLILKVYETLTLKFTLGQVCVLLSNHDVEFLCAYEKGLLDDPYSDLFLDAKFCRSLRTLQKWVKDKHVSLQEVHSLIEKHYLPRVCLYEGHQEKNAFILFSHAPVVVKTVSNAAKVLNVSPRHIYNKPKHLRRIIKQINCALQVVLQQKKLHTLLRLVESRAGTKCLIEPDFPLEMTIWNPTMTTAIEDTNTRARYPVENHHGHTGACGGSNGKFVSYDNQAGKSASTSHVPQEWNERDSSSDSNSK